jgi:tetratricopeptide (TPR) repeat protein
MILEKGNAFFPEAEIIYLLLGLIHHDIGDLPEAMQWYDRYLDVKPDNRSIIMRRAALAENFQDLELAMQLFDRALTLDPNNIDAFLGMGRSSQALGRIDKAIVAYKRVIQLDPTNEFAQKQLNLLK